MLTLPISGCTATTACGGIKAKQPATDGAAGTKSGIKMVFF
jgi:hypothetical protein